MNYTISKKTFISKRNEYGCKALRKQFFINKPRPWLRSLKINKPWFCSDQPWFLLNN